MPKQVSNELLDRIVEFVGQQPEGVKRSAVMEALKLDVSDRTMQRYMRDLIEERGLLRSSGSGKATIYFPARVVEVETAPATRRPDEAKLSGPAYEVLQLVTRPKRDRTPVGYNGAFLETYAPNRSFYLPEPLRGELAELGGVGKENLPAGTYLRQVMDRLIIDLSWNSSRLEGNTYSLLDTELLIERGESAEGKAAEETQMILNHKAAIEMLAGEAGDIGFNRYTICNLHALLSENLLPNPEAGGLLRSRMVGITQSVFEPLQVPQQIETYFDMILEKAGAIHDPFEQSFFVMVHLPYLQPFEDVNKRVSRLAANIPLIQKNLCPLSFVDVNKDDYTRATLAVYELNRIEYLRDVYVLAYKRSCARYAAIRQSLGEPDPFRLRYRKQIGDAVRMIVTERMDKRVASGRITEHTRATIDGKDQARFQEVVETELSGLHEGNIARYQLRLSEFQAWITGWK
jgi:Fic family protein